MTWSLGSLPYKGAVLAFSYFLFLFESYLNYRQYQVLLIQTVPKSYAHLTTKDNFDKARNYSLDKLRFHIVSNIWSQLVTTLIFYFNVIPWFWNMTGLFGLAESEMAKSLAFVLIGMLTSAAMSTPFSLYYTFVLEEKYGFNKQTLPLFFSDLVKSLLLEGAIGLPVTAIILYITQVFTNFYFYLWIFVLVFQLIMVTIYPTLIQPLFNEFTQLPEGELKKKIYSLAQSVKFPLNKTIFVMDGSKRSAHSNAYMYGFFSNKRLVLFDTLLEQTTPDETLAIIAHEIGHWFHSHVLKNLVIAQAHLFIIFYLFAQVIKFPPLYESFGFKGPHFPILIGFVLFQMIYAPAEALMGYIMNVLSRAFEFQADFYAVTLGHAKQLAKSLQKIHMKNLGSLRTDPYYSAWHYSHPPLVERLEAITAAESLMQTKKKD